MRKKLIVIFSFLVQFSLYSESTDFIDVVIPCHEKDTRTLEYVIEGIKKNVRNYRRIIVVSKRPLSQNAEWFDEASYPFNRRTILNAIFNEDINKVSAYEKAAKNRSGWMYQQFLKLYAAFVIPEIAENILIVDADTIFIKPVEFIDSNGNALYAVGSEYHIPYFEHAKRLLPGFQKVFPQYSGICHHMLFQRKILEQFFKKIEDLNGCNPIVAICKCIDHKHLFFSSFSEYELYFNYIFSCEEKVKIRPLEWTNVLQESELKNKANSKYHFLSWHNYTFEIN